MPLFLLQAARRRFALGGPVAVPLESACHLRPFVVSELPQQASPATGVYTWKPRDSIWATLIKAPGPDTIVVLHADDAQHLHPHRMAPECALPQSCPPGTCLLGQVVADPGASTTTVSILLFDILQVGRGIDVAKLGAKVMTLHATLTAQTVSIKKTRRRRSDTGSCARSLEATLLQGRASACSGRATGGPRRPFVRLGGAFRTKSTTSLCSRRGGTRSRLAGSPGRAE